jgi:RHS repeat-associated protein
VLFRSPGDNWDFLAESYYKANQEKISGIGGKVQIASGSETTERVLFSFNGARDWQFKLDYNSFSGSAWSHNFSSGVGSVQHSSVSWYLIDPDHPELGYRPYVTEWETMRLSKNALSISEFEGELGVFSCSEDGERYSVIHKLASGGYQLDRIDQSRQIFDGFGRLIQDIDPFGRALDLSYTNYKLSRVGDPVSGTFVTLHYDTEDMLERVVDSLGNEVLLGHSEVVNGSQTSGMLSSITNANGYRSTFEYDQSRRLIRVRDHYGNILTDNTFDWKGRVERQDHSNGHIALEYDLSIGGTITTYVRPNVDEPLDIWTYLHDSDFNLIKVTNPELESAYYSYTSDNDLASTTDDLGNQTSFTYDSRRNLLTATDPSGEVTTFTYDHRNNLFTTTDPLGQVTTRTYDAKNNLLTLTDPLSRTLTWTYDANSQPLTLTLPRGGIIQFAYSNGRVTQITDPAGVITKFGYDANGRKLYDEDALGNRTSYTYDAVGNVLTSTNALNQTTSFTYDHRNRPLTVTAADGGVTTFTYDHNHNLLSSTDPLGETVSYTYDGQDRLKTITTALGHISTFAYDSAGRITDIIDATGLTISNEYDSAGRLVVVENSAGERAVFTYDSRGNSLTVTDPLGRTSSMVYDELSRLASSTDPLGRQTTLDYDALSRLTQVTDPASLVTAQAFDHDGNLETFTNAASADLSFTLDLAGRLTDETSAEGHSHTYTYDTRGNLETLTEPSTQATTFGYDAANRLTSVTDDVAAINIDHDPVGRVASVTESGQSLSRVYDLKGRLTSYTDGAGNTIGYEYDASDRLTTVIYPDLKEVTYTYDEAGRLLTVTDWANRVSSYTYDGAGRRQGTYFANGTREARTYDAAGQLTDLVHLASDGTTPLYSATYGYDLAGQNIRHVTDPAIAPLATTSLQTFDADNRLTSVDGNLTTYDADGNLLHIDGTTAKIFSYDARNRLIGHDGITYTYDAEDRRIGLTDSSGATTFVVNPNAALDQVLVRTQPDGDVTYYVYGHGLLHQEEAGQVHTYHHDRRGDTVVITDGNGTVTDRADYSPYGQLLTRTGTTDTPFLFNGRWGVQTDANGIYYHRARYYSPDLRRFLNQDTVLGSIASAASMNRFAYANGNPVSMIDPYGLAAQDMAPNNAEGWYARRGPDGILNIGHAGMEAAASRAGQRVGAFIHDNVPAPVLQGLVIIDAGVEEGTDAIFGPEMGAGVRRALAVLPIPIGKARFLTKAAGAAENVAEGSFAITKRGWQSYPSNPNVPQPAGPFRLLQGAEKDAARNAANNANRAAHRADPSLAGKQIHEIQPVKFGGSPTDAANKVPLTPQEHTPFTTWWRQLQRDLER